MYETNLQVSKKKANSLINLLRLISTYVRQLLTLLTQSGCWNSYGCLDGLVYRHLKSVYMRDFTRCRNVIMVTICLEKFIKLCQCHWCLALCQRNINIQGHREGTSSVAFEVLIMNCEIDSINLFIFNYLPLNINLFIFNCLTSNFCFPKNIYFASRRERLFMDARP